MMRIISKFNCGRGAEDGLPRMSQCGIWYNILMKYACASLMAAVAFALSANGAAVEPLPAPEFADTEVSTNIPFEVSFDAMSRIEFSLSLDASPTPNWEVR